MGKITAIEPQKRNTDRVSVYVDDLFFLGISSYVCEKYKMKVGMMIDEEYIEKLSEEEDFEKGKSYVLKYLMDKTEYMVRKKLIEKDYTEKIIDRLISFLFQYNYLDDERFAKAYAHDANLLKKHGKKRIAQDLKIKGVSPTIIEAVLATIEDDEQVSAAISKLKSKVSEYKRKSKTTYELKSKCYAFLLRNGFDSNIIQIAISHFEE